MESAQSSAMFGAVGEAQSSANGCALDFERLLRKHQAMVFSIARNFLGDASAAEDVAQEVFLQLHAELGRIEGEDHATAWLRRVATHRSIDALRSPSTARAVNLDAIAEPGESGKNDDVLLRQSLQRMVASLPENQRIAIILRYQEDLEPGEIARVLGMPLATVKSHLRRGLDLLRKKSDRLGGTPGTEHSPSR